MEGKVVVFDHFELRVIFLNVDQHLHDLDPEGFHIRNGDWGRDPQEKDDAGRRLYDPWEHMPQTAARRAALASCRARWRNLPSNDAKAAAASSAEGCSAEARQSSAILWASSASACL